MRPEFVIVYANFLCNTWDKYEKALSGLDFSVSAFYEVWDRVIGPYKTDKYAD